MKLVSRDDWLCSLVEGATVLHLGCTDNPMMKSRIEAGRLFHERLLQSAKTCVGLDLDDEGIGVLRGLMPEHEFITANVESLPVVEELKGRTFDFVVAADILEHLSNPGMFLNGVIPLVGAGGRLLITTPQAYSIKRLGAVALGYEHVHPDHVAYFSVSTISQMARRAGLKIEELVGFQWFNPTPLNRIAYWISLPALYASRNRLCDELGVVLSPR